MRNSIIYSVRTEVARLGLLYCILLYKYNYSQLFFNNSSQYLTLSISHILIISVCPNLRPALVEIWPLLLFQSFLPSIQIDLE